MPVSHPSKMTLIALKPCLTYPAVMVTEREQQESQTRGYDHGVINIPIKGKHKHLISIITFFSDWPIELNLSISI